MAVQCICPVCGISFPVSPSRLKRNLHSPCCSRQCSSTLNLPPWIKSKLQRQKRDIGVYFWQFVQRCEHEEWCPYCCWPWLRSLDHYGYGQTGHTDVKMRRAHRVSWQLFHKKDLPLRKFAAHYCHHTSCCNPSHIHPATQKENMADSVRDNRMACGERIANAKLTSSDIPIIFMLHQQGMSASSIGRQLHVNSDTILKVLHRKTWWRVPINDH